MIYISDLDGTLVVDNKLSEESKRILNYLIDRGVQFTVASARDYKSIKIITSGLNLQLPVIALDGSYVIDYKTGKRRFVNHIRLQSTKQLLKIFMKYSLHPFFAVTNMRKDFLLYEKLANEKMDWCINSSDYFKDQDFVQMKNQSELFEYQLARIILTDKSTMIDKIATEIINARIKGIKVDYYENYYIEDSSWLVISSNGATKELAVQQLLSFLKINNKNVTYFGDHYNDIDVFKSDIKCLAVANAKQEIKELASNVIGNSTDDSVAKFILNDYKTIPQE